MKTNERNAGRKPLYGVPSKLKGVLIRIDMEKEMMSEINAVQLKYKHLPAKEKSEEFINNQKTK